MRELTARRVLTPAGWLEGGRIAVDAGKIVSVAPWGGPYEAEIAAPGFIDVHIHGGNWFNVMDPTMEGLGEWLRVLASHGVTGVLAGLYTAPVPTLQRNMDFFAAAMDAQRNGQLPGARLLGVQLEGPFISPEKPGAMSVPSILEPSVAAYREICHGHEDIVRLMAIAAERPGSGELIEYCLGKGVRLSLGHSAATAVQAREAFARGVGSVTHFYNAAPSIHHREPGLLAEALLTPGVYAEAICDLQHVHAEALLLLYSMKGPGRVMVISDGVDTTGLPDGDYTVKDDGAAGQYVVRNGAAYTPEGTLAGGAAYSDRAVRNLVSIGVPAADALRMAAEAPAQWLGLADRGALRPGARADIVLLDEEMQVRETLIEGVGQKGGTAE